MSTPLSPASCVGSVRSTERTQSGGYSRETDVSEDGPFSMRRGIGPRLQVARLARSFRRQESVSCGPGNNWSFSLNPPFAGTALEHVSPILLCMHDCDHLQWSCVGAIHDRIVGNLGTVQNRTGKAVMSCRFVPIRGCFARRWQAATISVSTRFAASRLSPAINHQMLSRSSVA